MTTATQEASTAHRSLANQLTEDLGWLEAHCRRQPSLAPKALQLRFAAALVRNLIGPYLDGQSAVPLHVVVVGGAGAGKSTIANFLAGTTQAESNPQAGFTRHPIAYVATNGQVNWPAHVGFLGPLQRLIDPTPASLDADVYQVRRVPAVAETFNLLANFVVWDCPDMTTWAASGYIPRLVEIAALADIILYVASDERYNDEVPTQFLQMLVQSGKAVIVCLTKMREADHSAFIAHFRQEVLSRIDASNVPVLTLPYLCPAELADPLQQAKRFQIPILNQVSVISTPPELARRRSVLCAADYLRLNQERLLSVARSDLAALQSWKHLVEGGQIEFDNRYRHEYLSGERFHRFDEAMARLLELLELPGVGRVVSGIMYVARFPYKMARELVGKAFQRPAVPPAPERPVLEQAMRGWLDMLRKEAARRADTHPLWQHIDKAFDAGLAEQAINQFEENFRAFQLSQADEADRTARAIYEELEKDRVRLNTLRGVKFTLEAGFAVGSVAGAIASFGTFSVWELLLAPLGASVAHHLVEMLGKSYVDNQREKARERQESLMLQFISRPMAAWLIQWPSTGGSEYERLQMALRRIPEAIQQIDAAVRKRMQ
jgi:GTP-binding protein EngB required for normal cell division